MKKNNEKVCLCQVKDFFKEYKPGVGQVSIESLISDKKNNKKNMQGIMNMENYSYICIYEKQKNMKKYEEIYDDVISVTAEINEFCSTLLFEGKIPERTREIVEKLQSTQSDLHEIAHELEEHLAWDNGVVK